MTTVGVVGLGNMGAPIAEHIANSGYDVVGYDVAGTAGRLPGQATAADSLDEIARRCDTVLLSVPDGDASTVVASGLAAAAERRVTVVVDLSTIGPTAAQRCEEILAAADVTYADGPVSGGAAGARARTIALMFAGPITVFDSHRPLFDTFVGSVFSVGDRAGQGQVMKLVNNYLSATALAATSEAFAVGRAHGLDLSTMIDVVNVSSGRNTATSDKFPRRVLTGTWDAGFATRLMAKDVSLYREVVARCGASAVVGAAVGAVWSDFVDAMPDSDFSEIWKYIAQEM